MINQLAQFECRRRPYDPVVLLSLSELSREMAGVADDEGEEAEDEEA